MRPLVFTLLISLTIPATVAAQHMPTTPPSTFPETGSFCGFLTLCPKAEVSKDK